ncbi:MotA/TolQ/ExbB proton channel family protein [Methylotenera sp. N17]|uniref:MotA/TolQ/ExbB proton channel family protein n=1 Tax=Methylotenera sp. N17 TaxID=1502761 RepID=UPI0006456D9C|nr:MotA/TolQ/ExbB proton channel family protein [Methylotenera sp. N17]
MNQTQEFNSLMFILEAGPVAIAVAALMLVMSVASWYLMVTKYVQYVRMKSAIQRYIAQFWAAPNLQTALNIEDAHSAAYALAHHAATASQHHHTHVQTSANACSHEEFVARSMRRDIAATSSQLESGLSVLASVGSVAPFVGLFGTVWGIYHALAAISASGQATLDKVAGPVGEALIMTAIGLAVAIPAVLAYNAFVKANRTILGQLDTFAQDLHVLMTTGATLAKKHTSPRQAVVDANATTHAANKVNGVPA